MSPIGCQTVGNRGTGVGWGTVAFLDPVTLSGSLVRLEPLARSHADALRAATHDGRVWELWYTSAPAPEDVEADITAKRAGAAAGQGLPFALRRLLDDKVVGVTTFLHPVPAVPAVEIGSTWYAASARRTGLNTEAKFLMLRHAFEVWGCRRVAFRATWFNHPSREAIERLGAVFEGRIRNDRVLRDGTVTDTAQYSLTGEQWPAVQRHLNHLLGRH